MRRGDEVREEELSQEQGLARQADAAAKWQTLLAGNHLQQGLKPEEVRMALVYKPLPDRLFASVFLKHTGYATELFDPDGVIGNETFFSLNDLWEAAGKPVRTEGT